MISGNPRRFVEPEGHLRLRSVRSPTVIDDQTVRHVARLARLRLEPDLTRSLHVVIRELDAVYLEHVTRKRPEPPPTPPKPGKGRGRA